MEDEENEEQDQVMSQRDLDTERVSNNEDFQIPVDSSNLNEKSQDIDLSLSLGLQSPLPPLVTPSQSPLHHFAQDLSLSTHQVKISSRSHQRRRKNPTGGMHESETIPRIYPWGTDKRATVCGIKDLISQNISTITGKLKCKKCVQTFELGFDLVGKYAEVARYILTQEDTMHTRASEHWMRPTLPTCTLCGQENSAEPIIGENDEINWLFLFLSQTVGCCNFNQLKYFCKYTDNHQTAAKDRLLYLAYLTLCKQLDPDFVI